MEDLEKKYKLKTKEAIDTAQKYHRLLSKKKDKVVIMYSGGMDSVSLAWSLLEHTRHNVISTLYILTILRVGLRRRLRLYTKALTGSKIISVSLSFRRACIPTKPNILGEEIWRLRCFRRVGSYQL